MKTPEFQVIEADAAVQDAITEEQKQFFLDYGFLIIRNVLRGEELQLLQEKTGEIVQRGIARSEVDEDYLYSSRGSGQQVYWRTEYIIDKLDVNKALLGHPFILRSVEKVQGSNFIPTWDSLVVKIPDRAARVPWHRDAEVPAGCTDPRPIFNVDFYLDAADERSCLWVIPGSNHWDTGQAKERCSGPGFEVADAVPVPMNPGDVIFHNIKLLHGSPEGEGNALRRTIYYEFRPGEIEAEFGPHTLEYLAIKQHMLCDCLAIRQQAAYADGEQAFEYAPTGGFRIARPAAAPLATELAKRSFRFPHQQYWRD